MLKRLTHRSRHLSAAVAASMVGGTLAAVLTAGSVAPATAATVPAIPWTWGGNSFGELGDGSTSARRTPGPVDLLDVTDVHGGREHVVTLRGDGTVWVWGSNGEGQLGQGNTANRSTPTQVPGLTGMTAVETGHNHSLALGSNGRVWTWGLNADGQLGDGSTTLRRSPVQVSGLTDAVAIAAGRNMSYALRADGTVVGWGRNAEGQLGDGTTTRRVSPVRVGPTSGASALAEVTAIAGGRDHGLAVRADGTVFAWGANAYGQVGDGSTTNRTAPVQVTTGVSDVIAGAHHSYALRTNRTVASWGRNYRANLGDGTTTSRTRPVSVLGVSDAVSIGSGRDHGLAVLADGRLRAWGYNAGGQLGDGTTTNRTSSILVPGVAEAVQAGGGGQAYSVILVGDGEPPANQPPVASASFTCTLLSCDFDGGGSADADGAVVDFAWDFGDGEQGAGETIDHAFATPGTYQVTLSVTDDEGAQDDAVVSVTVSDVPPPSVATFRASATTNVHASSASVVVPATVQDGDRLLAVVTTNRTASITVPAGWTQLGVVSDGTEVRSWLLTRTAATTAGTTVTVPLDALSKVALTLHAYDAGAVAAVASAAEAGSTANHVAPASTVVTDGSVVLRYWADKTSAVHDWTLPAGLTQRSTSSGSGGGLLTTVSGDAGPTAPGAVPTATATAGVTASKAVAWTVVLPPG